MNYLMDITSMYFILNNTPNKKNERTHQIDTKVSTFKV